MQLCPLLLRPVDRRLEFIGRHVRVTRDESLLQPLDASREFLQLTRSLGGARLYRLHPLHVVGLHLGSHPLNALRSEERGKSGVGTAQQHLLDLGLGNTHGIRAGPVHVRQTPVSTRVENGEIRPALGTAQETGQEVLRTAAGLKAHVILRRIHPSLGPPPYRLRDDPQQFVRMADPFGLRAHYPLTLAGIRILALLSNADGNIAVFDGRRIEWARDYGYVDRERGIRRPRTQC